MLRPIFVLTFYSFTLTTDYICEAVVAEPKCLVQFETLNVLIFKQINNT